MTTASSAPASDPACAMVGMAVGGFLSGYLYDMSYSYVTSWLISFASGLISSLFAMDLMTQSDRTKAAQAAAEPTACEPVPVQVQAAHTASA